jgi:poly-beta-1,6-N-acetyl-D-glucosamine biosynthesis protein PgaD
VQVRDAVLTAILWLGYVYLMRDLLSVLLSFFGVSVPWGIQFQDESLPAVLRRLALYGTVIIANTFVLFAWARYNQIRFGRRNRRRRSDAASPAEMGNFFALTPEQVMACQGAKRTVMVHDERGHLVAFGPFLK